MKISDRLWSQILEFHAFCRSGVEECPDVLWTEDGFRVFSASLPSRNESPGVLVSCTVDRIEGWERIDALEGELRLHVTPACDPDLLAAVRLYVPLCAAPVIKPSRSFLIVHMAQSVDGIVATTQGNSKWIGNQENLTHAHRLRALVDGVIVGGETARLDMPRLNVRHVPGSDPARILFSDTFNSVDSLPKAGEMRTILLRSTQSDTRNQQTNGSETLYYDKAEGQVDVDSILGQLRQLGIHTILLEGGPTTFRTFFQAGAISWVQFHIAPMLIGPGRSVLPLPEITELKDAISIRNPFYIPMGDAIMLTGEL